MIRAFSPRDGRLDEQAAEDSLGEALWIDLLSPDASELAALTAATGIELPSRDTMAEIEPSSRLYRQGGAIFMTPTLPSGSESTDPNFAPVTFALTARHLVTLRYHAPKPFQTYPGRADEAPSACDTPRGILLGLMDEIVDRLADLLEGAGHALDTLSVTIFAASEATEGKGGDFKRALKEIGRQADYIARLRYSLVTVERALGFLAPTLRDGSDAQGEARALVTTLTGDATALTQHADSLTQQATLLLDATLGLIDIEQSNIIKIFSVVAFVLLPPTLIASIYGMNFAHMPELGWRYAYPAVIGAMIVSAVLPYLYFKRRGWL